MGISSENHATIKDDLSLQVKMKKRPRFKAGAELSGAVNLTVEVNETEEYDSNVMEMNLHIQSERLFQIK
jgi:hypothetical protein